MQPLSLSFFERRRKGSGCTYEHDGHVGNALRRVVDGDRRVHAARHVVAGGVDGLAQRELARRRGRGRVAAHRVVLPLVPRRFADAVVENLGLGASADNVAQRLPRRVVADVEVAEEEAVARVRRVEEAAAAGGLLLPPRGEHGPGAAQVHDERVARVRKLVEDLGLAHEVQQRRDLLRRVDVLVALVKQRPDRLRHPRRQRAQRPAHLQALRPARNAEMISETLSAV